MPPAHFSGETDRRALLRGAILLVGGAALALPALAATPATFFTAPERATLDALCDALIPRTDTPGALDAGVPAFLDQLFATWASAEHQALMHATLAALDASAKADAGAGVAALPAARRTTWLTARDAALLKVWDPGWSQFKRLALTGYYYSEAGATQELRYELVPGVWEPAVPVTPDTRTWAA